MKAMIAVQDVEVKPRVVHPEITKEGKIVGEFNRDFGAIREQLDKHEDITIGNDTYTYQELTTSLAQVFKGEYMRETWIALEAYAALPKTSEDRHYLLTTRHDVRFGDGPVAGISAYSDNDRYGKKTRETLQRDWRLCIPQLNFPLHLSETAMIKLDRVAPWIPCDRLVNPTMAPNVFRKYLSNVLEHDTSLTEAEMEELRQVISACEGDAASNKSSERLQKEHESDPMETIRTKLAGHTNNTPDDSRTADFIEKQGKDGKRELTKRPHKQARNDSVPNSMQSRQSTNDIADYLRRKHKSPDISHEMQAYENPPQRSVRPKSTDPLQLMRERLDKLARARK